MGLWFGMGFMSSGERVCLRAPTKLESSRPARSPWCRGLWLSGLRGGGPSCLDDVAERPHCVTSVALCGLAKSLASLGLHLSSASCQLGHSPNLSYLLSSEIGVHNSSPHTNAFDLFAKQLGEHPVGINSCPSSRARTI